MLNKSIPVLDLSTSQVFLQTGISRVSEWLGLRLFACTIGHNPRIRGDSLLHTDWRQGGGFMKPRTVHAPNTQNISIGYCVKVARDGGMLRQTPVFNRSKNHSVNFPQPASWYGWTVGKHVLR